MKKLILRPFIWIPLVCAVLAWKWFPLSVWVSINQGLIAFLGLLTAALIQVIPVTANFLQADHLYPTEAQRLSSALEKQQKFWLGLLAATFATFVLVIIASAIPAKASVGFTVPVWGAYSIDVGRIASAILALAVSFLMARVGSVLLGVMSLQRLRSDLVIIGAKRRAAAEAEKQMQAAILPQHIVPPDYGKIIRPH